jgi:hypothetical protein
MFHQIVAEVLRVARLRDGLIGIIDTGNLSADIISGDPSGV